MKRLRDSKKGQVANIAFAIIPLVVVMVIGIIVLNNIYSSTISTCTEDFVVTTNTSKIDNTTAPTHTLSLSRIRATQPATLTVGCEFNSTGNVTVNGFWVGNLNATTPRNFSVTATYLTTITNITYTSLDKGTNITYSNLTYYSLTNCNYEYNAYNAMKATTDMGFMSFNIMPIVLLILGAVGLISAVYVLQKRD